MNLFSVFKIKGFEDILKGGIREIKNEIAIWLRDGFRKDMVLLYVCLLRSF